MDNRYFQTRYNPSTLQWLFSLYRINPQLLTTAQLRCVREHENTINGGFNYCDRFTSFLELDNSFLTPWNYDGCSEQVAGGSRERIKIKPGSFLSCDHMLDVANYEHIGLIEDLLKDEKGEEKVEEENREIQVVDEGKAEEKGHHRQSEEDDVSNKIKELRVLGDNKEDEKEVKQGRDDDDEYDGDDDAW